jgi:hypothetical protein
MASSYSTNTKLELVTTGEKAGLWGTITNTNLQILEQAASGYTTIDMAAASVTLTLTDGATSNGKNIYLKLTGTLAANHTLTMPATAERVWIIEDATNRNGTNKYTLGVLTASSSTTTYIPNKSTCLCRSDGTDTKVTILQKGYYAIDNTYSAYTSVAGDRVFVDTTSAVVTVNLPASPSIGDEVTIIDSRNYFASNAVTVGRNTKNINNAASDATMSTNAQAATFVYVDATCGWNYQTNTA